MIAAKVATVDAIVEEEALSAEAPVWEEEQGADPSFRRLREEEIETCVLDVRADDLAGQSY